MLVITIPTPKDLATLQNAAKTMSKLLSDQGLTEEDIVADFRNARETGRK